MGEVVLFFWEKSIDRSFLRFYREKHTHIVIRKVSQKQN